MCTVFVEFTSPPPTHWPPNPFSEGQTEVVCGDVGCVWMRGVGVKLGHGKSKQSSSSKAHSDRGDEQSCWWIHEITAFLGDKERMYLHVVLSSRAAHANIKWRFTDLHPWHRVTSDLGQTEFAKRLDLLCGVFTHTTALSGFEFPWVCLQVFFKCSFQHNGNVLNITHPPLPFYIQRMMRLLL